MNYQLTFHKLPFEPDRSQVIYVEEMYNVQINNFIREHYSKLRWTFGLYGYEFIYLPMLFKDEELERKVRYYAPYLETKIIDSKELRSSYMLNFLSRVQAAEQVKPSFLFHPEKHGDEWTFCAWPVQLTDYDSDDLFWILDAINSRTAVSYNSVAPRAEILLEPEPTIREAFSETCESAEPRRKRSKGFFSRMVDKLHGELFDDDYNYSPQPLRDEVAEILENLQENVRQLRLQGVTLGAIHEFIDKQETISPILITDDLRIFLPLYNNLEIVMPAQRKALYFLFLNHPEGIVLQRLEEHHKELMNYYRQTNGGVVTPRMEESIKKLETYGNNQLNVVITRIREAFCSKFDERLARHYYITGEKGQPYKIALSPELIRWEE